MVKGEEGRYSLCPDQITLHRKHLLLIDEPAPLSGRQMLAEVGEAYDAEHTVLKWWDPPPSA